MKPEPYFPPAPALTDGQRLILEVSAKPKGGPYPVKLSGAGQAATARKLVNMGLGTLERGAFTANARGAAAIKEEK